MVTRGKQAKAVQPQRLSKEDANIAYAIVQTLKKFNLIMSRDQNAALNILKLGRESAFGEDAAIAGLMTREAAWSLAKR